MTGAVVTQFFEHPGFAEGIHHFNAGEWFEAHEVWELLWRPMPAGADRLFVQGLIQLAVSLEHHRRANPRGSLGQRTKAEAKLRPLCPVYQGVAVESLLREADSYLAGERSALPHLVWLQPD